MHTPFHTADSSPSASASAHPSHRKPRSREQMCGVLGSRVTDPIQKRAETPRKYLEFSHSMRPYCPLLFSSSPLICFSCIYTNVCVCVCMYMRVVVCGTCICFSFFVFFFCFVFCMLMFISFCQLNLMELSGDPIAYVCVSICMCECTFVWPRVEWKGMELIDQVDQGSVQRSCAYNACLGVVFLPKILICSCWVSLFFFSFFLREMQPLGNWILQLDRIQCTRFPY